MRGLMQDWPMLCHRIIDHAAKVHGGREVVTRSVEGPIHRTNYAEIRVRALKVAQRLDREGIKLGDRVATIAWNTWRHLKSWYGIMGIGAICHTVNPRLFPDQIAWIINHAEDRIVMTDVTFIPILEKIADRLPSVERYVVFTDKAHMPQTTLKNAVAYEDWIAEVDGNFEWKTFDENTACAMCYTSGTTGDPKGVLYSHRSNVLHSLIANNGDALGATSKDTMLPVVPLFHANSWGIAFSAPAMGTKLVMPGAKLDGASVYELLDTEKVTYTAGVPTVWLMLLQHMEKNKLTLPHLRVVICGGSAMPRSMIKAFDDMGIEVRHAWGMTEMSPLGTVGALQGQYKDLKGDDKLDILQMQGYAPFMVEMKIEDDAGKELPWDGKTFGRLKVRGPGDFRRVFPRQGKHPRRQGLLRYRRRRNHRSIRLHAHHRPFQGRHQVGRRMDFLDRSGKSRGRPSEGGGSRGDRHPSSRNGTSGRCLIVQLKEGQTATREEILKYMDGKIAKWWMPDDVAFVDGIPHTATGKILKTTLRDQFKTYSFPTAAA